MRISSIASKLARVPSSLLLDPSVHTSIPCIIHSMHSPISAVNVQCKHSLHYLIHTAIHSPTLVPNLSGPSAHASNPCASQHTQQFTHPYPAFLGPSAHASTPYTIQHTQQFAQPHPYPTFLGPSAHASTPCTTQHTQQCPYPHPHLTLLGSSVHASNPCTPYTTRTHPNLSTNTSYTPSTKHAISGNSCCAPPCMQAFLAPKKMMNVQAVKTFPTLIKGKRIPSSCTHSCTQNTQHALTHTHTHASLAHTLMHAVTDSQCSCAHTAGGWVMQSKRQQHLRAGKYLDFRSRLG
eukprot:1154380-Pelagomonas_calceolata.AAC.3